MRPKTTAQVVRATTADVPARSDFRFLDRLRVRWVEVDMQKIVFNGHYLMYFDTAVAGYWRALAVPYAETMAELEGELYVRKATLEYEGSARYDDLCDVGIRCSRIGNSSLVFTAAMFRGEQRLVHGDLVYVFADPHTQTSRPVPAALRQVLNGFEAGEAMVDVRVDSWAELGPQARAIRRQVLMQEQRTDAPLDADADDTTALHAVAVNRFGLALAAGRVVVVRPGVGQLGRLAVWATVRGSGVGRAVLNALVQAARQRGLQELMLHSTGSASNFYLRAGFVSRGAPFVDAGLAHQEMVMALA